MKIRQEILKTNKQMNPLTSGPAEWGGAGGEDLNWNEHTEDVCKRSCGWSDGEC